MEDSEIRSKIEEEISQVISTLGTSASQHHDFVRIVCRVSPYCGQLLLQDSKRLHRVTSANSQRPISELLEDIGTHKSTDALDDALRRVRNDEFVRLTYMEFASRAHAEVGRALSNLADAALEASLSHHYQLLVEKYGEPSIEGPYCPPYLAILSLGKLGGQELNFSSDIDVVCVYPSDKGSVGEISLHEFFSKLVVAVTGSIATVTEDQFVFRVDHRLRPEGASGPMVNSLAAMERYYESWGTFWERLAWQKARVSAGDKLLGERLISMLQPFVYSSRHNVIAEIQSLHQQVVAQTKLHDSQSTNLKTGDGGIRSIEFFAQSLQLLHARRDKALRLRGTRETLEGLFVSGFLSAMEHRHLRESYDFFRLLEHLLQWQKGQQTQEWPANEVRRLELATRLGVPTDELQVRLEESRQKVSMLFAELGTTPQSTASASIFLVGQPGSQQLNKACEEFGFDPQIMSKNITVARTVTNGTFSYGASSSELELARNIIVSCSSAPSPDHAFGGMVRLLGRKSWPALARFLRQNSAGLRLLTTILGASDYLGKMLVDGPNVLETLTAPLLRLGSYKDRWASKRKEETGDPEAFWNELSAFKHQSVLRIALADLAGAPPSATCLRLSELAEDVLAIAFEFVRSQSEERYGALTNERGETAQIGFVAFGKLGGRELGYGGDLDVAVVHDAKFSEREKYDGETVVARLVQRVIRGLGTLHLSGRIYEVDMRLRPSGSHGTLVTTIDSWRRFYDGDIETWQCLAASKMRPLHHSKVAALATTLAHESARKNAQQRPSKFIAEVREMKRRVERERGGHELAFKTAAGGLMDLEFIAQVGELFKTNIESSTAESLGRNWQDANLVTNYWFLRRIEMNLRLVNNSSAEILPKRDKLQRIARSCGETSPDEFLLQVTEIMKQNAACFSLFTQTFDHTSST